MSQRTSSEIYPPLAFLPALDIREGMGIGLHRGESEDTSEFQGVDPFALVQTWVDQGASAVHLVDLDAAFGRGENKALLSKIVASFPKIEFQISGGIHDEASCAQAFELGAFRVVLATQALQNFEGVQNLLVDFGEKIVVALDVRENTLSPRGTSLKLGSIWDALTDLNSVGCKRYLVTDVVSDGALSGSNIALLQKVLACTNHPVLSSGGVSSLDDLKALRTLTPKGLEGVVVGKALYAQHFTFWQALDVTGNLENSAPSF